MRLAVGPVDLHHFSHAATAVSAPSSKVGSGTMRSSPFTKRNVTVAVVTTTARRVYRQTEADLFGYSKWQAIGRLVRGATVAKWS